MACFGKTNIAFISGAFTVLFKVTLKKVGQLTSRHMCTWDGTPYRWATSPQNMPNVYATLFNA